MTMFATHAAGEVIDAIRPDLEAFTSLWTALRVNYEGTNITRTVARLLHMYQPEEGVIAYERLLRTLFVLLEDFDSDGLQLLVSMVPPPKGVSDELVKEVFNRATGFVRVDAPIFHKNTYFQCMGASSVASATTVEIPHHNKSSSASQKSDVVVTSEKLIPVEITNTAIDRTAENDLCSGQKKRLKIKSPQINSQESGEMFRGFPPSEIHNTQSHVQQSMRNFYRPSNSTYAFPSTSGQSFVNFGQIVGQNSGRMQQPISGGLTVPGYRPKWFQTPYLVQKNGYPVPRYHDLYLKTVNNQFVKITADKLQKNFHRGDFPAPTRAPFQTLCGNAQNFSNNGRSSQTVTSGLLEKIQQRWRHGEDPATRNESLNFSSGAPEVDGSEINAACGASDGGRGTSEENSAPPKRKLTTFLEINNNINKNNNNNNDNDNDNSKSGNLAVKKILSPDNRDVLAAATNRSFSEGNNGDEERLTEFRDGLTRENSNVSVNRKAFEDFAKEVRMRQRAIQEDIYKMDVVRCDEFVDEEPSCGRALNDSNTIKAEILTASEELRKSCKGFLERVKIEETVEVPILPRTRSLSAINEERAANGPSDSNLWKLLTSKNENSESNTSKNLHTSCSPPDIFSKNQPTENSSGIVADKSFDDKNDEHDPSSVSIPSKRPVQRRKKIETAPNNQPKNQKAFTNDRVLNITDESINLDNVRAAKPDSDARNNSHSELTRRCPQTFNACQTASDSSVSQVTTMAELAAYKKQYYDALLSIQKAKVAVANSLAISSVGNPVGFDPYYYNYVQHHRHQMLHRHQRQMIVGHRFPQQQSLPPSSPWFRAADWRYPLIETSRLPQRPQMLHPSSSLWPPRIGFLARDSQASGVQRNSQPNVTQHSKPQIKRRKLEEIVGKLKESETNGGNN